VLAVLLGTAGVRLGCAWSCQPLQVTTAAGHCHEASVAAFEFSAASGCNDARAAALLVPIVRPDGVTFASADRLGFSSPAAA